MARINYQCLPRPVLPEKEYVVTVGDQSETLRFRKLDPHEGTLAVGDAQRFAAAYAVNYFPMPDGEAVQVTDEVAQSLAFIRRAQVVADEADRLTMEDLLGMMKRAGEHFLAIQRLVGDLNKDGDPKPGDAAGN